LDCGTSRCCKRFAFVVRHFAVACHRSSALLGCTIEGLTSLLGGILETWRCVTSSTMTVACAVCCSSHQIAERWSYRELSLACRWSSAVYRLLCRSITGNCVEMMCDAIIAGYRVEALSSAQRRGRPASEHRHVMPYGGQVRCSSNRGR
jgi:hypothetical protein